jgi:hypothetical protein
MDGRGNSRQGALVNNVNDQIMATRPHLLYVLAQGSRTLPNNCVRRQGYRPLRLRLEDFDQV